MPVETTRNKIDSTLLSWCIGEVAPWKARSLRVGSVLDEYDHLNRTRQTFFLFDLKSGRVSIREKSGSTYEDDLKRANIALEQLDELDFVELHEIINPLHTLTARALLYRRLIQRAVQTHCPDIDVVIPFDLDDHGLESKTAPLFAFQKPVGSKTLLLPDPDFLSRDFYRYETVWDQIPYHQKRLSAVFSGSTTGGFTSGGDFEPIPRVKSALFFKDSQLVDFRLPLICQADREGEQILRELGFGAENYLGWEDQYEHKFIMSIDGNGATCSRVVMALSSNGALLKYHSNRTLYYFKGMLPWYHFVPIGSDREVYDIIEIERNEPGFFKPIADAGKEFWRNYLSEQRIIEYTGLMLQMYCRVLDPASPWVTLRMGSSSTATRSGTNGASEIAIRLHVQDRGNLSFSAGNWAGLPGSGLRIEGLSLAPSSDTLRDDLEYSVTLAGGAQSAWAKGGKFCGTRGMGLPLRGVWIRLAGESAKAYQCSLTATFTDGRQVGPLEGHDITCQIDTAELEAVRLELLPLSSPQGLEEQNGMHAVDSFSDLTVQRSAKPADSPTPIPDVAHGALMVGQAHSMTGDTNTQHLKSNPTRAATPGLFKRLVLRLRREPGLRDS
jgi:hypothetical protein